MRTMGGSGFIGTEGEKNAAIGTGELPKTRWDVKTSMFTSTKE